ncbi:DNA recombination protein RmuC [Halobacteriovorax sp. GB3]|uniref:DNA recombination protein RmuC n=1 Tax=Halobacteriovorax sp. GB3 TaxID=2719615 RepID=UPI00236063A8|nr:DNA recombination protein RmuC [Halobacteriovorax sp. GB3]MDD0852066.1 DNA recombination protein RmuC [Halobacteriovorax sp. GB3]
MQLAFLILNSIFSLLIFCLLFILWKKNSGENSFQKMSNFIFQNFAELRETLVLRQEENREKINREIGNFKMEMKDSLHKEFVNTNNVLEERLDKISNRVRENLDEGFKKTNETFANVIQRLARIDEAQKKIESLSSNVVSLQDVLTDKKSRGIFGEVQLNHLLASVFGDKNDKVYALQHKLSTGKIVDSILFMPEPTGNICVDSKFPLENFKRMFDKELDESQRAFAQKEFARNVKKHIDDIANKYIITNETSDQAIMFLPAEAIFAELHAYHPQVIEYANSRRIWIASPTTFMATLTTLQSVLINIERNKYMGVMHEEINKLGEEFKRYQERWGDLSKHLNAVTKDVDRINITSNKISNRFQKILEVELEQKHQQFLE